MGDLQKISFRVFKEYTNGLLPFFPDLKTELKQAGMPYTTQEYVSMAMFVSVIALIAQMPTLSFVFSIMTGDFLFGFMLALFASFGTAAAVFFVTMQYPKMVIGDKEKQIDNALPFAAMYLSTIAGSKLPLHKAFEIFSKFSRSGEILKQVNNINEDIKIFGQDVVTALERAIDRSPSKKLKDMLYGILSSLRTGSNMNIFLKEKASSMMADYRRKLTEFSHALTVYVEIYLTAIVLGAIFFTVLTAIISGISGGGSNIILLQFFLVFVFMPLISMMFIWLVRSAEPGGE